MTIHFCAGVDCGEDAALASAIVTAFRRYRIAVSPELSTVCSADAGAGEHGRRVVLIGVKGAQTGWGPGNADGKYTFLTHEALDAIRELMEPTVQAARSIGFTMESDRS